MYKLSVLSMSTVLLICFCLAGQSMAMDDDEYYKIKGIKDRFSFGVGSFLKRFDSAIQLSFEGGGGTEIDLERDLGFSSRKNDIWLGGYFRFNHRHRVRFGYAYWNRNSEKVLETTIEIPPDIYEVGLKVNAGSDIHLFETSYQYSFLTRERYDAGITLGISTYKHRFAIEAEGEVSGGPSGEVQKDVSSVVFPVPLLGGFFDLKLRDRLFWKTQFKGFWLHTSGWEGDIFDFKTGIMYYPLDNLGLSAGFEWSGVSYRNFKKAEELYTRFDYYGVIIGVMFIM